MPGELNYELTREEIEKDIEEIDKDLESLRGPIEEYRFIKEYN
jgi:hypothetical protein